LSNNDYYERNFDPWILRAVQVDHEDYSEYAEELHLKYVQSPVWFWFAGRLNIDQWFLVSVSIMPPDIEAAYDIHDHLDGEEMDVFLSYMGSPWCDVSDPATSGMFASVHRQFANTVDPALRDEIMKKSKSEIEAKRHAEEEISNKEFREKMADANPKVKIVLEDHEGREEVMGVYSQGVVMEGPDALLDVAMSAVIMRRHPLHGWHVENSPMPVRYYPRFYIQGA
jgi:hypothetical protein